MLRVQTPHVYQRIEKQVLGLLTEVISAGWCLSHLLNCCTPKHQSKSLLVWVQSGYLGGGVASNDPNHSDTCYL